MGEHLFAEALEMQMWGRVLYGCHLNDFGSPGKLLVSSLPGSENLYTVYWLTKSILVHPKSQKPVTNLGQENDPTCPALHPLTRHSTSSIGLNELSVMSVPHVHLDMLSIAQASAAEEAQYQYMHSKVGPLIPWCFLWLESEFSNPVREYLKKLHLVDAAASSVLMWASGCCSLPS